MAKGLRSKVKQRWKSLRRQHLENIKVRQDVQDLSNKLQATIHNQAYRKSDKKNAFLNPDDPNAEFPQYKPPPLIDFRSAKIPIDGDQFVGARRKKNKAVEVVETNYLEEEQNEEQDVQSNDDDLAQELADFNIKSKKEKRKNKQNNIDIEQVKKPIAKINKNRRKKEPLRKSKKIMKF